MRGRLGLMVNLTLKQLAKHINDKSPFVFTPAPGVNRQSNPWASSMMKGDKYRIVAAYVDEIYLRRLPYNPNDSNKAVSRKVFNKHFTLETAKKAAPKAPAAKSLGVFAFANEYEEEVRLFSTKDGCIAAALKHANECSCATLTVYGPIAENQEIFKAPVVGKVQNVTKHEFVPTAPAAKKK